MAGATSVPTSSPTTSSPSSSSPSALPLTSLPTDSPSFSPVTSLPSTAQPVTESPTSAPISAAPSLPVAANVPSESPLVASNAPTSPTAYASFTNVPSGLPSSGSNAPAADVPNQLSSSFFPTNLPPSPQPSGISANAAAGGGTSSGSSGSSAVVGAVIAIIFVIICCIVLFLFFKRNKEKKSQKVSKVVPISVILDKSGEESASIQVKVESTAETVPSHEFMHDRHATPPAPQDCLVSTIESVSCVASVAPSKLSTISSSIHVEPVSPGPGLNKDTSSDSSDDGKNILRALKEIGVTSTSEDPLQPAKTEMHSETFNTIKSFIGISVDELTRSGKYGATILALLPGGPGANAGLMVGDVIKTLNGIPLANSSEFSSKVALLKPGSFVSLSVVRNNAEVDFALKLSGNEQDILDAAKSVKAFSPGGNSSSDSSDSYQDVAKKSQQKIVAAVATAATLSMEQIQQAQSTQDKLQELKRVNSARAVRRVDKALESDKLGASSDSSDDSYSSEDKKEKVSASQGAARVATSAALDIIASVDKRVADERAGILLRVSAQFGCRAISYILRELSCLTKLPYFLFLM